MTSAHIPVAKANHTANPNINEAEKYTPFTLVEGIAKSYGKGDRIIWQNHIILTKRGHG